MLNRVISCVDCFKSDWHAKVCIATKIVVLMAADQRFDLTAIGNEVGCAM